MQLMKHIINLLCKNKQRMKGKIIQSIDQLQIKFIKNRVKTE